MYLGQSKEAALARQMHLLWYLGRTTGKEQKGCLPLVDSNSQNRK